MVTDKVLDDTQILICTTRDKDEVWSDVFGSGYWDIEWIRGVEFVDCSWDKHGTANVTYIDPDGDGEETTTQSITVIDIANAMSNLTTMGWTHCGGDTFSEPDVCSTDAVLQVALMGEFVYG